MNEIVNPKVDISGLKTNHIKILWQTLYDILSERGELGNYEIIVKNVKKKGE